MLFEVGGEPCLGFTVVVYCQKVLGRLVEEECGTCPYHEGAGFCGRYA